MPNAPPDSSAVRFGGRVRYGKAILDAACQLGVEGIFKKRGTPYRAGRGGDWVKAKCRPGQEVVIGGWRQEPQRRAAELEAVANSIGFGPSGPPAAS